MNDISYEILDLFKKYGADKEGILKILEADSRPEVLYALSDIRRNLMDWMDFSGQEHVLQLGSDYGVITGLLAERCASVAVVDERDENLVVNQKMNEAHTNISYMKAADFQKMEAVEKEGKYDLVVLQNAVPMEVNEEVARYAYEHQVDVVLNPTPVKKLSKEFMQHITYLIVNEQAAKSMTGVKIHSDWKRDWTRFNLDEARVASAVIRGRGVPTVLVTLGEKGVIMNTPERFYYKKAVEDVELIDPRAAGDAFIGAFCTRICTDDSVGKVLSIANYTAALSIATPGAIESLPTSKKVREYMEQKRDA